MKRYDGLLEALPPPVRGATRDPIVRAVPASVIRHTGLLPVDSIIIVFGHAL